MEKEITKNIMFFIFILKSLTIQLLSPLINQLPYKKIFLKQKNIINFQKNIIRKNTNKKEFFIKNKEKIWIIPPTISAKIFGFNILKIGNKITITRNIGLNKEELKFRLNKMNQRSQIKILKYNKIVHSTIEKYLRMEKYIRRMISLTKIYFPIFEEKLKKYNLPIELKYLAIIESSLNPLITSKSGARGIWQFMPKTGKIYNLNTIYNSSYNSSYDERIDPIKSTEAACKYLKFLYSKMGKDWELVLASYNAGPGTVNKVLKKYNEKKFWKIYGSLPTETQKYIPRFIAINYIMNYYKEYNLSNRFYRYKYRRTKETSLVYIKSKLSIKFFSKILNLFINYINCIESKIF